MKKAQSTLEYAIVIFAIIAALLSMQVYIRRGIQGKMRSTADEISVQQYEPKNTVSDVTLTQISDITTKTDTTQTDEKYNTTTNTTINSQTENRNGTETVGEAGS
jgi:exopolysaccharide biosynthesis protein